MAPCDKCSLDYFQAIAEFYNNDARALTYLRDHSVLPSEVICPHCSSQCSYREDQRVWRCRKSSVIPKSSKRRRCGFSVSDSKGTFLDHTYIAPWKVLLFINHFLSHLWDHKTVIKCLNISSKTSVDWRCICSEVCSDWFLNQEQIGGEGAEVEIDETQFVSRKYERGRQLNDIWRIPRKGVKKVVPN